jgi:hypothetical protein
MSVLFEMNIGTNLSDSGNEKNQLASMDESAHILAKLTESSI